MDSIGFLGILADPFQVTGVMKWLGPAWFVLMPFLTLVMPYIGVNQAFMIIGSTTNR